MTITAREALKAAARLVEEKAIRFDEEAAEVMASLDDDATEDDLSAVDGLHGRANSLRRIAADIRRIETE